MGLSVFYRKGEGTTYLRITSTHIFINVKKAYLLYILSNIYSKVGFACFDCYRKWLKIEASMEYITIYVSQI